jgi:hypothetical protein
MLADLVLDVGGAYLKAPTCRRKERWIERAQLVRVHSPPAGPPPCPPTVTDFPGQQIDPSARSASTRSMASFSSVWERHHHVVRNDRERHDLVDDRRDLATRTLAVASDCFWQENASWAKPVRG